MKEKTENAGRKVGGGVRKGLFCGSGEASPSPCT
jgi:hypothetical protein